MNVSETHTHTKSWELYLFVSGARIDQAFIPSLVHKSVLGTAAAQNSASTVTLCDSEPPSQHEDCAFRIHYNKTRTSKGDQQS